MSRSISFAAPLRGRSMELLHPPSSVSSSTRRKSPTTSIKMDEMVDVSRQLDGVSLGPYTAVDRLGTTGRSTNMSGSLGNYKIPKRSAAPVDDSRNDTHRNLEDKRQEYTDNRYRRDRRSNEGTHEDKGTYRGRGNGQGKRYPDRWVNYDPIGKEMTGTRFVAFKCPLDQSFFAHDVHQDEFFDIHTLVGYARDAQRRLGMVIDLTATTRYYNKDDWYDFDVEYRKIVCPGHEVHGRDDLVQEFHNFVDDFLERNKDNDKLIGVHCTHGLNRTGYLICRYLIDRQNWTADDAIRIFEECRGHSIERPKYKDTLREAQKRRDSAKKNGGIRDKDDETYTDSTAPPSETDVPLPPRFDDDNLTESPAAESLPPPPTF